MAKIPVIKNEEFILYLEQMDDCVVIHCDVLVKWTKGVKQRLSTSFGHLTDDRREPFYALHLPGDKKHNKFLKMFGFELYGHARGTDGNDYDIYVWR